MLVFHGLVTKDNIWILARRNKCGMEDGDIINYCTRGRDLGQDKGSRSHVTDKHRKERRAVIEKTTGTEEGVRT